MASVGRAVGRLLGVPKAPKVQPTLESDKEEDKQVVMPTEQDENTRAAMIERERMMRNRRGRAYTSRPGRSLGGTPSTLG